MGMFLKLTFAAGLVLGLLAGSDPASAAPSPTARPVLFIGDSHTAGTFGRAMDGLLRTLPNASVTSYGSCGSAPSSWFAGSITTCGFYEHRSDGTPPRNVYPSNERTPLLLNLLRDLTPDTVVVALGANIVMAPLDHVETTSRRMADAIVAAGSRCIWVGPPHGRNKPEPEFSLFYDRLRETVGTMCTFIDSRPFAHYPDEGGDGVHYDHLGAPGRAIARAWAQSVFNLIQPIW